MLSSFCCCPSKEFVLTVDNVYDVEILFYLDKNSVLLCDQCYHFAINIPLTCSLYYVISNIDQREEQSFYSRLLSEVRFIDMSVFALSYTRRLVVHQFISLYYDGWAINEYAFVA